MRNTSPRAGNVSVRQFGRISRLHGLAIVVALLLPAAFPGAASAVTSWSRSGSASLSNSGSTSVSLTGQDLSGDYENTSFSGTVNCPGINGGTGFVSASGSLAPGSIPAYTDESAVAEDASSAHVTMAGYSTACGPWPGDYYQVQIQLTATTRNVPTVSGTTVTFRNSATAAGTFCWVFAVGQDCTPFTGSGTIQSSRSVG